MKHIQLQLNMLSLGHLSPAVIPPRGLKKLLIERVTYQDYLGFHMIQKGMIWKFYQTLTFSTLLDEGKF